MRLFVKAFFVMIIHPKGWIILNNLFILGLWCDRNFGKINPLFCGFHENNLRFSRYRVSLIALVHLKVIFILINYMPFHNTTECSIGEVMCSMHLFGHSDVILVHNVRELVNNVVRSGDVASVSARVENLSLFIVTFLL